MGDIYITQQGQLLTTSAVAAATVTDLSINADTYGKTIPLGFGLRRVLGQVIASSPIDPTTRRVTFAVSFGYSGYQERERLVRRVWLGDNMQLVYDASQDIAPSNFTLRFYSGAESQEADPDLLTLHPDTPAYREHTYMVLVGLNAADYGNRLPTVIVEIIENASSPGFANAYTGVVADATSALTAGVAQWVPDFTNRKIYALGTGNVLYGWNMATRALIGTNAITGLPSGTTTLTLGHYLPALARILAVAETATEKHPVLINPDTGAVTQDFGNTTHAQLMVNSLAYATRSATNTAYDSLGNPVTFVLGFYEKSSVGVHIWKVSATTLTLVCNSDPSGRGTGYRLFGVGSGIYWTGSGVDDVTERCYALAGSPSETTADFYMVAAYGDGSTWWEGTILRIGVPADATSITDVARAYVYDNYQETTTISPVLFAAYDLRNRHLLYADKESTSVTLYVYDEATEASDFMGAVVDAPTLVLPDYGFGWQHNALALYLPTTTADSFLLIQFANGGYKTASMGDGVSAVDDAPMIVDGTNGDIVAARTTATWGPVAIGIGTNTGTKIPVSDIILGAAYKMGYGADEVEAVNLTELVTGAVFLTNVSFRGLLDDLCGAFGYRKKQSDVLTVQRVDAPYTPAAVIAPGDIIERKDGSFSLQRAEEASIPNQIEVSYLDEDYDYVSCSMLARRPSYPIETSKSWESRTFSLPVVMSGSEAAGLAAKALYREWTARTTYSFRVLPKWIALEPLDVVQFTVGGRTYTGIVIEASIGADFSVELTVEAVWDERSLSIDRDSPIVLDPVLDAPYNQSTVPTAALLDDSGDPLLDDSGDYILAD